MGQPDVGMADPEEALAIASSQETVRPLLEEFDYQFRKVSEEKYAPKKRNKRFAEYDIIFNDNNIMILLFPDLVHLK